MSSPGRFLGIVLLLAAPLRAQEDRAAALAEASAEAAEADGTLSLLLAREAFEAFDVEPARTALYAALVRAHEQAILRGHEAAVVCVDVSQDGQVVATGSDDKTVRLWTAKGTQTALLPVGAPARDVRLLGGDRVLVATATELAIWDAAGKKLVAFPRAPFDVRNGIVAISPAPDALRLVDANGKVLKDLKVKGSGPAAGEFAFWALTSDGKLRWYDARGREKVVTPAAGASRAVFAASAPILATFGVGIAVELWSPQCKKLGELLHVGPIEHVSIAPKGDRIFTASADGHYAFWSADGKRQNRIPKPGPCLFAAVSEDGLRVATLDDKDRVTVWTWDGVPVSKRFEGIVRVEPNRRGAGLILDFKDGTRRFLHAGLEEVRSGDLVAGALAWSGWGNRGEWLLVADDTGDAALQHWYGPGPAYLDGHTGAILDARFSEDDAVVATGSRDLTARVWDLDPPGVPALGHPDRLTGIGYEPLRLLTCSRDVLHIREEDGRLLRAIQLPSPMIWWGHGADRVAVACKDEVAAWLFDLEGKEIARLKHDGVVNGVEVAPAGDLVVTFSADKTARLWDARGKLRATLDHPQG
ncbi:MAG: WD40 repeat domain-containing protein, partial [Planctomycetota bacterium]